MSTDRSTRMTKDLGPIVTGGANEKDNWFTPVDIRTGPDRALDIADWYSLQSNHYRNDEGQTNADFRSVYRLSDQSQQGFLICDLRTVSSRELAEKYLAHSNRWYRETALRLLGDRRDPLGIPQLQQLATNDLNANAVEALWALDLYGGLDDALAQQLLGHAQATVRSWKIFLLAERESFSPALAQRITQLAVAEPDVERNRSRLASEPRGGER